ncbi:MAG: hypothetical protein ACHQF2_11735 [Flavobacteriales bacterium]
MQKLKVVFLALFLFTSSFEAISQQDKELLFSGEFTFTYADKVKIKAGGVVTNKTRKELQTGTKVGDVAIDPAVYKKMESEAGTQFRIEIKKYGKGNFREITLTNLQKKQSIKGLYDITTREMLFATAKGKKSSNDCGSIGMGVVKGRLSADMKKIDGGEFAIGFIAGCNPVIVGASVTFYYNAVFRTETAGIGSSTSKPEPGDLWAANEDTVWIRDRLMSCRWHPEAWSHKGTQVTAKPEDFGHFYSNGLYECALLTVYDKGTWNYDGKLNTINLTLSKSTTSYVINEITDSTMHCTSFSDEFVLKKITYKNNTATAGMVSNKTSLLSHTWKIRSHKKGMIPVTYQPNDFVRIHHDGRYEQVFFNTYKTGTWHWTEPDKKLTVYCGGSYAWEIKSISDKEIILVKPNETLTMVKP